MQSTLYPSYWRSLRPWAGTTWGSLGFSEDSGSTKDATSTQCCQNPSRVGLRLCLARRSCLKWRPLGMCSESIRTGAAQGAALPGHASRPVHVFNFSTKGDLKFCMKELGGTLHGFPKAPSEGAGRRTATTDPSGSKFPAGAVWRGQSKAPGVLCVVLRGPRSSFPVSGSQPGPQPRRAARAGGLAGGAVGSAAALRAALSMVWPPWAGGPLPLPLPLLPAGGDRTKSRDVAERAGEARGERLAAAGGVWGSLRVPARLRGSAAAPLSLSGAAGRPAGVGARSVQCWAWGTWEDKLESRGSVRLARL